MQVRITKTEHGLVVPMPEDMLAAVGFNEGDVVYLYAHRDWIEVADPSKPHYDIEEMLAQITDENRPAIVDWGAPVGRDIW